MTGKKTGADAGTVVDDLRNNAMRTREDLASTTAALAAKADVKERVADTTREVGKSMRRRPGSWAAAVAGILAGTAAVATLRWRKAHRTPKSRAERAWQEVRNRVRKAARAVR